MVPWILTRVYVCTTTTTIRILNSVITPKPHRLLCFCFYTLSHLQPPVATGKFRSFSKMSYTWNHTVCNLLRLASVTQCNAFDKPMLSCVPTHHSFLLLMSIAFCGYTTIYSFTQWCPLGPFRFWLVWIPYAVAIKKCVQRFLCELKFSFLQGKYLGVGLLCHIVVNPA